jgi:hypothetical protein
MKLGYNEFSGLRTLGYTEQFSTQFNPLIRNPGNNEHK